MKNTFVIIMYLLFFVSSNIFGQCAVVSVHSFSTQCNGLETIVSIDIDVVGTIPPFSYLWSNGKTTEDIFQEPSTDSQLCVTITDGNGCQNQKCFDCAKPCAENSNSSMVVEPDTAINAAKPPIITIYPNPFLNEIIVLIGSDDDTDTGTFEFKFYDLAGRLVHDSNVSYGKNIINLANLANAAYLISILDENKKIIVTKRIIKIDR
jgi:hypothetical protein